MRLFETTDEAKIEEIVSTELSTEEGDIDFFFIGEQMDKHELVRLSSFLNLRARQALAR